MFQTCLTFFLLCNIREDILKNVGNQTVSVSIDFHCMDKECNGTETIRLPTFFKISSLMLHRRKKVRQVWNIIRVSKWRQNFNFCVDYHFNKVDFFYRHLWSNLRMKKRTWVTRWSIPARFTLTDIRRHTLAAVFTMSVTHHWENTKVLAHNHYDQNSLYLEICKCLLTSFTSWSHVAVRASAVVSRQTAATVLTRRITASWETRCVNSYNIPGNPQNMQKAENSYAERVYHPHRWGRCTLQDIHTHWASHTSLCFCSPVGTQLMEEDITGVTLKWVIITNHN